MYKKFNIYFLIVICLFLMFHFLVWNIYTKYAVKPDNGFFVGDLGRISYQKDSIFYREDKQLLEKKHKKFLEPQNLKADMITLGDSFSNGGGAGLNKYYQDYIATNHDLDVLNIGYFSGMNYIDTIISLVNSNLINKIQPKYILISSVNRNFHKYLLGKIDENKYYDENKIKNALFSKGKLEIEDIIKNEFKNIKFINNLNFKALKYTFFYNFDDNAYESSCYIFDLKESLFNIKNSDKLLITKEDLYFNSNNIENIKNLNKNLNQLSRILKKKGITLIYMPVVDKYDLYFDYIKNNKYPAIEFFDKFRKLKKEYIVIDTKEILMKLLEKKEKDIFYSDDTHWSYKASEAIFKDKSLDILKKGKNAL